MIPGTNSLHRSVSPAGSTIPHMQRHGWERVGDSPDTSIERPVTDETHVDEPAAVDNKPKAPTAPRRERFVAALKKVAYSIGVFFEKLGNIPYKASSWTGEFSGKVLGCVLGSPFYAVSKIFKWAGDSTLKTLTITINVDDLEESEGLKQLEALVKSKQGVNTLILKFETEYENLEILPGEVIVLLNQMGRQVKSVELKNTGLLRGWQMDDLKHRWLVITSSNANNFSLTRKLHLPSVTVVHFPIENSDYSNRIDSAIRRAFRWIEVGTLHSVGEHENEREPVFEPENCYSDCYKTTNFTQTGDALTTEKRQKIVKKALRDLAVLEKVANEYEAKYAGFR